VAATDAAEALEVRNGLLDHPSKPRESDVSNADATMKHFQRRCVKQLTCLQKGLLTV
jgi:hypothetical protein